MKLYMANATRQFIDFHYRPVEAKGVRIQRIPPGAQIPISGDLNQLEIAAIIKQHEKYGLVKADQVKNVRHIVPLIYDVDRPVTATIIDLAMRKNNQALVLRGKEARKLAAVSASNTIEDGLQGIAEQTRGAIAPELNKMEVVVEQVEDPRAPFVPSDESPGLIGEAVRVTRHEPGGEAPPKKTGGRKPGPKPKMAA